LLHSMVPLACYVSLELARVFLGECLSIRSSVQFCLLNHF
jgi:hypothetical protein